MFRLMPRLVTILPYLYCESVLHVDISQILMAKARRLVVFAELKALVQKRAAETGSIFFQIDIEPPG